MKKIIIAAVMTITLNLSIASEYVASDGEILQSILTSGLDKSINKYGKDRIDNIFSKIKKQKEQEKQEEQEINGLILNPEVQIKKE